MSVHVKKAILLVKEFQKATGVKLKAKDRRVLELKIAISYLEIKLADF